VLLKEDPERIEQLQEDLWRYAEKPSPLMPFDGAIWVLEAGLENFIAEAHEDLKVAEASGNAVAASEARRKEDRMFLARSSNGGMSDLDDLRAYFEQRQGGIK
jgi:hypothetical protein